MTVVSAVGRPSLGRATILTGGLAVAVGTRAVLNSGGTAPAFAAGAGFGLSLLVLAAAAGMRPHRPDARAIGVGVAGGLALIAVPFLARSGPGLPLAIDAEPFALWVAVTTLVAVGEEAILRGALFRALQSNLGSPATVALTSLGFALLHVPLYGWHVVPLDLAVGIWLAGLRLVSGGVAAPAIAHVLADLATWWL